MCINELAAYIENDHQLNIKDNTYAIAAPTLYLLGIEREYVQKSNNDELLELYDSTAREKTARIVHYLCLARATLERDFGSISRSIKTSGTSIYSANDTIKNCVNMLYREGVELFSKNYRDMNEYVIETNKLISDRINNCRDLFPDWLNWDYLREFFIMPNGLSAGGVKTAGDLFMKNRPLYPFQTYCNWPVSEQGFILANDRKFVTLLYRWHDDELYDQSKVSDVGEHTKEKIYRFIGDTIKVVAVVDCENSDPYRLCAAFKQLNDEYTGRISKIVLIDDEHTSAAWDIFEKHVGIPVEHKIIERLLENKSRVDMTVAMTVTKEFYGNNTDAFMLIASDSDYWSLIDEMPEARFIMMVEREKFSPVMKEKLTGSNLFYCYIDDFYTGDNEDLQKTVIVKEIKNILDTTCDVNLKDVLRRAIVEARARISEEEFNRIYSRMKQNIKLTVSDEGDVKLEIPAKALL